MIRFKIISWDPFNFLLLFNLSLTGLVKYLGTGLNDLVPIEVNFN